MTSYGLAGFGPPTGAVPSEFGSNAYTGGAATPLFEIAGYSGVYRGSLSAQGNMVAMQLNPGAYQLFNTGRKITITRRSTGGDNSDNDIEVDEIINQPYCTGYFRTYYKDPTKCTFGADSAMPALTLTVPASITDMPGNFLFYVDLQLTRLTGSNQFNSLYFLNAFNQAISWVTTSNNYVAALKRAENTNLRYYGSTTYQELITQGLVKYQQGSALRTAFRNIGLMVSSVALGRFGTPNAVAKTLIDLGLGAIGNLSSLIYTSGVNVSDIYNPNYTLIIKNILAGITAPGDLETIQAVVQSTIPNMTSALDYCSIEASSGLPNDSVFKDFAETGVDLYQKAPNFSLPLGKDFADLLDNLQSETGADVESLATPTSLLPPDIIAQLKQTLPISPLYEPISLLDIIGTPSGYLIDWIKPVNAGLAALYATSYGPQIRTLLSNISRYAAQIPLNGAEADATEHNPSYWTNSLNTAITQYYQLLDTIVADKTGNIPVIVQQINDSYEVACQKLRIEYINYNKANFSAATNFDETIQILTFVSSVPGYGDDANNIGTDYILYGMASPNAAGSVVKSLLGQNKNNSLLANAGVRIGGLI